MAKMSKAVAGKKYSEALEQKNDKKADKSNRMVGKPADISGAISRAKKKTAILKVKPQKKQSY